MLTDNEKRWLQLRKLYAGVNYWSYYSCMHCPEYNVGRWRGYNHPCDTSCLGNGCPNIDIRSSWAVLDYVEAVEFEARVAAKLANIHFGTEDCPYCSNHINVNEYCGECKTASTDKRCLACRLKYARLKVEEEMDADMDK